MSKLIEIIEDKQILIDKSDLDFIHKQIADLETQLAESETLIQRLQSVIDNLRNKSFAGSTLVDAITNVYEPIYKVKFDECEQLKQQLAEKEKEIETLKQRLKDTIKIYSDDFVEKDKELKELRFQARNIFPLVENLEDKVNQDKIEFAVEQLEKVKELAEKDFNLDKCNLSLARVLDKIDNQINELKEGK